MIDRSPKLKHKVKAFFSQVSTSNHTILEGSYDGF